MKHFVLSLACFCFAIFFFTQCQKNVDSATSPAVPNYSPLTVGSSWTYRYIEANAAPGTFKITVTNRDTIANGKTYKVLANSDGSTNYLAKNNNDYYRFASFPSIGINNFEELYLKDNKAINDTWSGTATFIFSGQNITANLNYVLKGKGESRTVNGKVFNNVMHVRLDIALFGSGIGGGDFYYQDGVGLIENIIAVTPPIGQPYSSKEELIAYEIK